MFRGYSAERRQSFDGTVRPRVPVERRQSFDGTVRPRVTSPKLRRRGPSAGPRRTSPKLRQEPERYPSNGAKTSKAFVPSAFRRRRESGRPPGRPDGGTYAAFSTFSAAGIRRRGPRLWTARAGTPRSSASEKCCTRNLAPLTKSTPWSSSSSAPPPTQPGAPQSDSRQNRRTLRSAAAAAASVGQSAARKTPDSSSASCARTRTAPGLARTRINLSSVWIRSSVTCARHLVGPDARKCAKMSPRCSSACPRHAARKRKVPRGPSPRAPRRPRPNRRKYTYVSRYDARSLQRRDEGGGLTPRDFGRKRPRPSSTPADAHRQARKAGAEDARAQHGQEARAQRVEDHRARLLLS